MYWRENYAESFTLNEEALTIARTIERADIVRKSQILDFQLRVVLNHIDVEVAIIGLEKFLEADLDNAEKANLHYALWKQNGSRQTDRETAITLYDLLYNRSNFIIYRSRYEELTGNELPPPAPSADVPSFVAAGRYDLLDLLNRIDELLES
ncbi:MAG: hypothetical protein RLP44_19405 [Aggregatilineales bacterium]